MSNTHINLDELLAQRAEAIGVEEGRIPFTFGENTYTFQDPISLDQEQKDELEILADDGDLDAIAEFWMGEEEFDRFVDAGGSSSAFLLVVQENAARTTEVRGGRPTRRNRSWRRAAARKR